MIERDAAIAEILSAATVADGAIFVGNGNNARATAVLGDHRRVFYMLGSMGLCASIAVGYACTSELPTVVIEGDGNLLMGLNMLPAVARCAPPHFAHVVLDNGLYETTGGQRTLADRVDFAQVALASSYQSAISVDTLDELARAVRLALEGGGPALIAVSTKRAVRPRHPRVPLTPPMIRARFEGWNASHRGRS